MLLIQLTVLRRLLPPFTPLSFIEMLKEIKLNYIHSSCSCLLQWIEPPKWKYHIESNSKKSILWRWSRKYLKLRMKNHELQFPLNLKPESGVCPSILRKTGKFERFVKQTIQQTAKTPAQISASLCFFCQKKNAEYASLHVSVFLNYVVIWVFSLKISIK